MADVKISDLPTSTTPLDGSEIIPVVQYGLTKMTTISAVRDGLALASDLTTHESDTANPHAVTAAQVGLGNVDNTSDAAKPVSTAQQTAIDAKVSKTGDTMTGPLSVPAGATGAQVPQAQEVVLLTGAQTVAGVKTFSSRPKVPAGATLDEVPQAQEIFGKAQSWQTVTRTSGVSYTNSTNKPIIFVVSSLSTSTNGFMVAAVNGAEAASSTNHIGSPSILAVYLVVPPGSTYSFTASGVTSVTVKEYR